MDIVYKDESYSVMGACFEVYKEKGCGFVVPVFQECMEIELGIQEVPFDARQEIALTYKGRQLKQKYIPDFICYDKIIVELKAVDQRNDKHRAQVHNYLKASGHSLGLLVNFGSHPRVEYERIVR